MGRGCWGGKGGIGVGVGGAIQMVGKGRGGEGGRSGHTLWALDCKKYQNHEHKGQDPIRLAHTLGSGDRGWEAEHFAPRHVLCSMGGRG